MGALFTLSPVQRLPTCSFPESLTLALLAVVLGGLCCRYPVRYATVPYLCLKRSHSATSDTHSVYAVVLSSGLGNSIQLDWFELAAFAHGVIKAFVLPAYVGVCCAVLHYYVIPVFMIHASGLPAPSDPADDTKFMPQALSYQPSSESVPHNTTGIPRHNAGIVLVLCSSGMI